MAAICKHRWTDGPWVPAEHCRTCLGIPLEQLIELMLAGLLRRRPEPRRGGRSDVRFSYADLAELFPQHMAGTVPSAAPALYDDDQAER